MAKVGKAPLLVLHTAAVRRALPFALKERCKNAFKEGHRYDFDHPLSIMVAAINVNAFWGYCDFRPPGEGCDEQASRQPAGATPARGGSLR